MAFLRNRTINLINLHYGIFTLAMGMGGVFYFVFLLKSGLSISAVLLTLAGILLGRFAIRPFVLVYAKRWGLKSALVLGTVLISFQYPMLAYVHGTGAMLIALIVVSAIADSFYWPCYHAYFASLGDEEHRGHQIGAREAMVAIIGIVAPLMGAWMIVHTGPRFAFACVGIIEALGALPLIGTPKVEVKPSAPGAFKAAIPGIFLFAADGWFSGCYLLLWQVSLFITLGDSFQSYGGAMALAALVGAAGGMLLGRHIDAGHGRRAAVIAYGVYGSVHLFRILSLGTPWLAISANALGSLAICLQVPAMMTIVYNQAKQSPCVLRFHIATEGGWDFGGAVGCCIAAALAAYAVPLQWILALGFIGLGASTLLLRHYYGDSDLKIEPMPVPETPGLPPG
jgi:MFS transporter, DHA1 family, inner membrane transport protein